MQRAAGVEAAKQPDQNRRPPGPGLGTGRGPYDQRGPDDGNALLGVAPTEALLADSVPIRPAARQATAEHQLTTVEAADSATKRLHCQTLRVAGPLREITQHVDAGPIPLAAAWAADGLRQALDVIA